MVSGKVFCRCWLPALVLSALMLPLAIAQDRVGHYPGPNPRQPATQPQHVAGRTSPQAAIVPTHGGPASRNEHPLMPALRWAHDGVGNVEKIQDYSATLVKRERIKGTVSDNEYMFVKVRHQPFSVYMYFLAPASLKGQEVVYVDGQNGGKLQAHGTGFYGKFGTVSLPPDGMLAMRGNRYPITEVGILNLVRRLVEVAEQDIRYDECDVKFFKNTKINNRTCTCIQVVHPVPRKNFLFHMARIFVDDELNLPIRYESYDWPKTTGEQPELLEQYTYLNLKINNGFTDADFDTRNPNYGFR